MPSYLWGRPLEPLDFLPNPPSNVVVSQHFHSAVVTPVLLGVRSVLALRHWMLSQEIRSQESWN